MSERGESILQEEGGKHSKSKLKLKRCINELGNARERVHNLTQKQSNIKLAAPKPVRARPTIITHNLNTKWMQTSLNTSETDSNQQQMNTMTSEVKPENDKEGQQMDNLGKGVDIQTQPQVRVGEFECKIIQIKKKTNPFSDLEALLEAEQELNQIFNKNNNSCAAQCHNKESISDFLTSDFGLELHSGFSQQENLESINSPNSKNCGVFKRQPSFTKMAQYKAQISRPTCNPILKDDRFRSLNDYNENLQINLQYSGQDPRITRKTLSNSLNQDCCNRYDNEDQHFCYLPSYQQQLKTRGDGMAFSQATSPTANSSNIYNPFSLNETSNTASTHFSFIHQPLFNDFAYPMTMTQQFNFSSAAFQVDSNVSSFASSAPMSYNQQHLLNPHHQAYSSQLEFFDNDFPTDQNDSNPRLDLDDQFCMYQPRNSSFDQ